MDQRYLQKNLLLAQLEAGQLASYSLYYLGHGRRFALSKVVGDS